jgi:hypothetical protein
MTEAEQPPKANKKAALVFLLVFALAAFLAIRAPDYGYMPIPRAPRPAPGLPVPPQASAPASILPGDMPGRAAAALKTARQWRPDAALVRVEVKKDLSFLPVFTFISPSDNMRLDVTGEGKTVTTAASPAGPKTPAKPIVLRFIDLPAAANFAKMQGMTGEVRAATLSVGGADQEPVWTIQTGTDKYPYSVDAVTGLPAGRPTP